MGRSIHTAAALERWVGPVISWVGRHVSDFHPAAGPRGPVDSATGEIMVEILPHVLVVDDNPEHQMAVSEMLSLYGIEPRLASDGAAAVELATAEQFDIILMDLQMPVLDGLAACKQIRRFEMEHGRVRVPVVAYTSRAVADSVLTACGLDAVLEKPCSAEALGTCLERWSPSKLSGS